MTQNAVLDDLQWRGLIAQSTDRDKLAAMLDRGSTRLYCGFDPTAPSLHVGNLVPLLTLRRFQEQGHRPIALVGGATGLIGDPSGRTSERSLNDDDVVAQWVQRIDAQVSRLIELVGDNAGVVVSNLNWTRDLGTIEFLRDIGKHFSVNVMLSKESVKTRLGDQGISFTEFSYMLLQAYDYLMLYRRDDCRLQIGGSDQWGNITAGLDLIRKIEGPNAEAHALTVPLVTQADGTKFGKTAAGAIWLDSEMTSPYEFHQYWLNADDRDVENFLKYFSLKPRTEIESIMAEQTAHPASRAAQRVLADELTELVHGDRELAKSKAAAQALFGRGVLAEVDAETVAVALQAAPQGELLWPGLDEDWPTVVDLLVLSGLCESRGAARRVITEGGAYLNNERVGDQTAVATDHELLHSKWWVLRRGKRTVASVEVKR